MSNFNPRPKQLPALMLMLPLMLGMDTTDMAADGADTTVDTMATLTDTVTTEARGLLIPNLKPMLMPKLKWKPKPNLKLIPLLRLGTDTMAVLTLLYILYMMDTTDGVMETDTDTTVKKLF